MIEMKIAINGFGRIGRLVYRLMKEDDFFDVVAINDLSSSEEMAYLLRYDTNHRTYDKDITFDSEVLLLMVRKLEYIVRWILVIFRGENLVLI